MAACTYSPEIKGYIADTGRAWFKRCDGKVFYFDELTQTGMSINQNNTTINAGWSLFPVAVLPGSSTLEMNFTSGRFDAELFSMTNAVDFADNADYEEYVSEIVTVGADKKTLTLSKKVADTDTIVINGLHPTSTEHPDADYTIGTGDPTVITLTNETEAASITVTWLEKVTVREALIDNQASAVGEVTMAYPVYSSGDDCTESGILGYVYVRVFRARVSGQPVLGGSLTLQGTRAVKHAN